jgi:hypothetical protein
MANPSSFDQDATSNPVTLDFASERMTRENAAGYLGVTPAFLEADISRRKHNIPYYKIGSRVFYIRSDLNRWLAAHRQHGGSV